jgi:flagellar basal-body rod protein FlgB
MPWNACSSTSGTPVAKAERKGGNMSTILDQHFGNHDDALRIHQRRLEQHASNLANSDTPGYKARDFDFKAALGAASAVHMQIAHPRHIAAGSMGGEPGYRVPFQPSLDGNTVEAEIEMSRFAETALRYQTSLTFVNRKIQSLMLALTGGN